MLSELFPGLVADRVSEALMNKNAPTLPGREWYGEAGFNYHAHRFVGYARRMDRFIVNMRQALMPVMAICSRKPIHTVFEVGCGNGWQSYLLSKIFPHIRFVPFDISEQTIDMCRTLYPDFNGTYENGFTDDVLARYEASIPEDASVPFFTFGAAHNMDKETFSGIAKSARNFRDRVFFVGAETQDPAFPPDKQPSLPRPEMESNELYGGMPIYSHNYPAIMEEAGFDVCQFATSPTVKTNGRKQSLNYFTIFAAHSEADRLLEGHEANTLLNPLF